MHNFFSEPKENRSKLHNEYKQLIEGAYNFRETDHSLSDILEYEALKLLDNKNVKHSKEGTGSIYSFKNLFFHRLII